MAKSFRELIQAIGGLQLPSGAGLGKLLGSDASGNASWQQLLNPLMNTAGGTVNPSPGQFVVVNSTSATTVNLPNAPAVGSIVDIGVPNGTSGVTVQRQGTDTIRQAGWATARTAIVLALGSWTRLVYDGANWDLVTFTTALADFPTVQITANGTARPGWRYVAAAAGVTLTLPDATLSAANNVVVVSGNDGFGITVVAPLEDIRDPQTSTMVSRSTGIQIGPNSTYIFARQTQSLWTAISLAGVGMHEVVSTGANLTAQPNQRIVVPFAKSGGNITLPSSPVTGTEVEVLNGSGSGQVVVSGSANITANGSLVSTNARVLPGKTVRFNWTGSAWYASPPEGVIVGTSVSAFSPQQASGSQAGVVGAGDLALSSLAIGAATAVVTVTVASGVCWVRDGNTGALIAYPIQGQTATSGATQPVSGSAVVQSLFIDAYGRLVWAVSGSVSGQLTGTNLLSHAPTLSNATRILDVAVYNNAGTYEFGDATIVAKQGVNWFDRRPWSQGAFASQQKTDANATTSGTGMATIDANTLQARLELSGNPVRVHMSGDFQTATAGEGMKIGLTVTKFDGTQTNLISETFRSSAATSQAGFDYEAIFTPSAAGSYLFTPQWASTNGAAQATLLAAAGTPVQFDLEEQVMASAMNGTV